MEVRESQGSQGLWWRARDLNRFRWTGSRHWESEVDKAFVLPVLFCFNLDLAPCLMMCHIVCFCRSGQWTLVARGNRWSYTTFVSGCFARSFQTNYALKSVISCSRCRWPWLSYFLPVCVLSRESSFCCRWSSRSIHLVGLCSACPSGCLAKSQLSFFVSSGSIYYFRERDLYLEAIPPAWANSTNFVFLFLNKEKCIEAVPRVLCTSLICLEKWRSGGENKW